MCESASMNVEIRVLPKLCEGYCWMQMQMHKRRETARQLCQHTERKTDSSYVGIDPTNREKVERAN